MTDSAPRIPLWLKVAWTVWLCAYIPVYVHGWGPQAFLWFCNVCNLVVAAALWTESPLLFSWQAVSVLAVQIGWCVDLASRLVFGFHPLHSTEYMFDPKWPLYLRLFSLFHAVMPVLLLWALRRFGFDRRAILVQVAASTVMLPVSWLLGPGEYRNINWTWAPFGREQTWMPPFAYLLVAMVAYPVLLWLPTHVALALIFRRVERKAP